MSRWSFQVWARSGGGGEPVLLDALGERQVAFAGRRAGCRAAGRRRHTGAPPHGARSPGRARGRRDGRTADGRARRAPGSVRDRRGRRSAARGPGRGPAALPPRRRSCSPRQASASRPPRPSGSGVVQSRPAIMAPKPAISAPRSGPPASAVSVPPLRGPLGRRPQLERGEVAVERVVVSHRRDQRPRQVDAHLPHHAPRPAARLRVGEGGVRRRRQLPRPAGEGSACSPRDTASRATASRACIQRVR